MSCDNNKYRFSFNTYTQQCISYGHSREKICLRWFANNKGADQPAHPRRPACASAPTNQRLCYSRFGKSNI